MDNHNIDCLSIDNWKMHSLSPTRFLEQKDKNNYVVFVLMKIFQILKYVTITELFSANNVKTCRDYIFDMILQSHFEKHEDMMNNIVNDTDLVYTIDKDQRAKVRKELENVDNDDNNTNDKNTDNNDDAPDIDSK